MKHVKKFELFEFESYKDGDVPYPSHVLVFDKLYSKLKKVLLPKVSDKFGIKYDRGNMITIKTDNPDDLNIVITKDNDKLSLSIDPVDEVDYEFNFPIDHSGVDSVYNTIESEFSKPNGGLKPEPSGRFKMEDDQINDSDFDDINTPITSKPKRKIRSININIIRDVLEDAFILDDIDLLDTDVDELIRRMLLETRSRRNKR